MRKAVLRIAPYAVWSRRADSSGNRAPNPSLPIGAACRSCAQKANAADLRILAFLGQPASCACTALRILQSVQDSRFSTRDASNGGWDSRSCLDVGGVAMNGRNHYEDLYESALWCLGTLIGCNLGEAVTQNGVRYRHVDGLPLSDSQIFERAWGKETADYIANTYPR